MRQLLPSWLVVCLACLFVVARPFAEDIVMTEVVSPGYTWTEANAINAHGHIAGNATTAGPPVHAMMWVDGTGIDLGALCSTCNSMGNDINDADVVVGFSTDVEPGSQYAVKWENGVISQLPPLPDTVRSVAVANNNAGDIVGVSTNASNQQTAVLWRNGVALSLGTASAPTSINDAGDILFGNRILNADGSVTTLQGMAGCPATAFSVSARGINESRHVAGSVTAPVGPNGACVSVAAIWVDGTPALLPLFPATAPNSSGAEINEHDDVVGFAVIPAGIAHATLWRDGAIIDLGALPFTQPVASVATDINDSGVVAGQSRINRSTPAFTHVLSWTTARPNTPPVINVPSDMTIAADSPGGIIVDYFVDAYDAEDGSLTPVCSQSSGSTFTIGETTVTCTVTDSAGLSASGTFVVMVLGAYEQAQELYLLAAASGPGGSLESKMFAVLEGLQTGTTFSTMALTSTSPTASPQLCGKLQAFVNEVRAQAGKKRIGASQAAAMISAAQRIQAVIGC